MDNYSQSSRILLNIQMIADELSEKECTFEANIPDDESEFCSFGLFCNQKELADDVIYILTKDNYKSFPVNEHSYISPDNVIGSAPHIRCLKTDEGDIINIIASIFERYHKFESKINSILLNNGSSTELLEEAGLFFNNPMMFHDRYFTVISISKMHENMLKLEKSKDNRSMHIPLWLINSLKFDQEYQDTFNSRKASIWEVNQEPYNMRCLYVNIYDGSYYLGRLIINELDSEFKPSQFRLAEIIAEYVKSLFLQEKISKSHHFRDYEDTVRTLIRKGKADGTELNEFLEINGWEQDDTYVCAKLQSQDPNHLFRTNQILRSNLPAVITDAFDFFHDQRLCLLINLTKSNITRETLKSSFAEFIRENLMYCGISNPIKGINYIGKAFNQTDYVLQYIKSHQNQWILSFDECAISYILQKISSNAEEMQFIAPELITLLETDKEKGTEYFKTLRAFLKNERSIPKTSEELIIHRTTLQYRLEKINEIIKRDLDKEKNRLYFELSFLILEKQQKDAAI